MTQQTLSKPFADACPTRDVGEKDRDPDASIDIAERIRARAAQGLKPRDTSSMLGVHPMIVVRLLGEREAQS